MKKNKKKNTVEYLYGVKNLHHLKDVTVREYYAEKIRLGKYLLQELANYKGDDETIEVMYRIKEVAKAVEHNKERLLEIEDEIKNKM